jgi:hypothetical protein
VPLIDTINPIDEILQLTGVKPRESETLNGKLKLSRLDTETLLSGVSDIASNGDSDSVRLQALKIGLQLNPETRMAMHDEQSKATPSISIVIIDSQPKEMNPILFPRRPSNKVVEISASPSE